MRRSLIVAAILVAACTDSTDPGPFPAVFELSLQPIATGLNSPVYLTSPPGDARLFVVEQAGRIRIISNGQVVPTPFLDITSKVLSGGERGLLSVAFHPQYATNGFFYVFFTGSGGELRIERYTVSAAADRADDATARLILVVPHLRTNHNGGLAVFGPDGMLYLGLGDGGGAGDPDLNGQNQNTLLGALLRIDVNNGNPYAIPPGNPFAGRTDARQEIWALGLRNPWRFSFDRTAGLLYIADVGQNLFEEVNVVPAVRAGVNYGWNIMEASFCFIAAGCNRTGLELPVLEYSHGDGSCSITGGFAYRGGALPEIAGHYFYADYCVGIVKSFLFQNGVATERRSWDLPSVGSITSFGEDASRELYVISGNGSVYKFVRG